MRLRAARPAHGDGVSVRPHGTLHSRSSRPKEEPIIPVDRRTLIADAALRLIGTAGTRALTHRGVDAEAGLPAGSTSYYCRRRVDLLALALRRHATLDLEALSPIEVSGVAGEASDFAAVLATGLSTWMRC